MIEAMGESRLRLAGVVLSISLLAALLLVPIAKALSVEEYCRLSIELLQASVEEWRERVAVASRFPHDQSSRRSGLNAVAKKYKRVRRNACAQYGASPRELLNFMAENKEKVDSYLQSNHDVRLAIDSLTSELHSLVAQYESQVESSHRSGSR
jgi:hypothetical protein